MFARKTNGCRRKCRRQLGPEVGEHAEPGVEGLGLVQVVAVLPHPAEGGPVGDLEAGQVHAAAGQEVQVLLREVGPDDRDEVHVVKKEAA